MKEIVILEAFAGLLKGRQIWHSGRPEIHIPIPRPLGISTFDFEGTEPTMERTYQVGVFKWNGRTDDEGMRIFELVKIED